MDKDSKRILFWLVIAVVIIGSLLALMFSGGSNPDNGDNGRPQAGRLPEVGADEWYKGNPDADVMLVEYSDFQCPACKSRLPSVESIVREFNDHIRFTYRHFPLRSIHANAQLSAQAAEAAGFQGQFWEMHDELFETQEEWSNMSNGNAEEFYIGLAENLGLDVEKFEEDMNSSSTERQVNQDYSGGLAAGVNSTPSFFLNGEYINPRTQEEFRQLIRDAIGEMDDETESESTEE